MLVSPRRIALTILICATLVSAGLYFNAMRSPAPKTSLALLSEAREREAFGKLPLQFIENRGQADSRAAYYVQGSDKAIYFTDRGLTFVLNGSREEVVSQPASFRSPADSSLHPPFTTAASQSQRWALRLDFVGARAGARPEGEAQTDAVVSYFKGHPSKWKTGLKTYSRIVYRDLWPGIDLVYAGTINRMKYTFVVRPGADPNRIRLAYRGASGVALNRAGQLDVQTPAGGFTDDRPVSFQDVEGKRVEIATSYRTPGTADSGFEYGFDVGQYDPRRELVIDPEVLIYAGFIGGGNNESGNGIAVDGSGNAYITGETTSAETTFPDGDGVGAIGGPDPTFNGDFDAFVAKVNAAGTALVYVSYLGGNNFDRGYGIAVDASGNAYVTGQTSSSQATFPDGDGFGTVTGPDTTFNSGFGDAFVAKINAAGTGLAYAGYIGGNDDDRGYGIAVDSAGNAYVSGYSQSSQATFPDGDGFGPLPGPDATYNGGGSDAFVAKVNATGTALSYAGYIGGAGDDYGYAIALDGLGNCYLTGETNSPQTSFPDGDGIGALPGPDTTFNGDFDAFVAKVNSPGTALLYAGYIGGSGSEASRGIAVDGSGNAYVTGRTASTEATFPDGDGFGAVPGPDVTYNGGFDAFVAKVNIAGTGFGYAGYIGGSDLDFGLGIAVDNAGNAHVTGYTLSSNATFPDGDGIGSLTGPDTTYNGGEDAFVVRIDPPGLAFVFAGYLGGSGNDTGRGIALDSLGNVYVTGSTLLSDTTFPDGDGFGSLPGPDTTYNGGGDAFVVKIGSFVCSGASIIVTTTADAVAVDGGCSLREAIQAANTNLAVNECAAGASGLDTIYFNLGPGTPTINVTGSALPSITEPVVIDGSACQAARVELNGAALGSAANGLTITAGNSTIRGLVINRFPTHGIRLETGGSNVVENCLIGTDVAGTLDRGNVFDGIYILNSSGNHIGGTAASQRNLVSGNNAVGIEIITNGVGISANNVIQGNFIGTDLTGTQPLGNSRDGIGVFSANAASTQIGGTAAGAGNLISANGIQLPSSGAGVALMGGIGHQVQGNLIGTDLTGLLPLGNLDGVRINTSQNVIGGTAAGAANRIAHNTQYGLIVFNGTGNAILSNSIFSNAQLGIDHFPYGVTPNDAGDGDAGANNLQNFPVLTLATPDRIQGTLHSAAGASFTIQFFSNTACDALGNGEGQAFIGQISITADAGGNAVIDYVPPAPLSLGAFITATATDAANNTSEFSACRAVTLPTLSIDDVSVTEGNAGTIAATFTVTLSPPSAQAVSVQYATANGTAVAPGDYAAIPPMTLSFPPGSLTQTITVLVNGDAVYEPVETFFVNLSNPANATIADAQGKGTILNDDCSSFAFLTKWGSVGSGDGQFRFSDGVAVDSSGNVYVADRVNNRIQKFDANGVLLHKWGSQGAGDGQFDQPWDVAADSSGNVYVTELANHRVQKFDSNGTFLLKFGSSGTGDGQFASAFSVAVNAAGQIFVADRVNHRVQKFDSNGNFLLKWGSFGTGSAQFKNPGGIAVDSAGNVYVSDSGNRQVKKFDANGNFLFRWGSFGTGDGQFSSPMGLDVDGAGRVSVADYALPASRIQIFDANGNFLFKWGSFGSGDGQFNQPTDVEVNGAGEVYVADSANHRVQKFRVPVFPAANAGLDQILTSPGGAIPVTLNGLASSDPDGGALLYEWRKGAALLGTGAMLTANLPVGTNTITLRVTNPCGFSAVDTVLIKIGLSTPVGSGVIAEMGRVGITYSNVTGAGATFVEEIDPGIVLAPSGGFAAASARRRAAANSPSAGGLPAGYTVFDNLAYEITTTATYNGPITTCYNVPTATDADVFANLRVFHNEDGMLIDRTILSPDAPPPDFGTKVLCARSETLGWFVLATRQLTISEEAISAQQGSPATTQTITRVYDPAQAAETLSLAITPIAGTGVTLGMPAIAADGAVTASVQAGCDAISSFFELKVTNSGGKMATAILTVIVLENAPPALSYNPSQAVAAGGAATILPVSGPLDNGTISSIQLVSAGGYTGGITVDPLTGVIGLTGAKPGGTFTLTIRATDQCGATTDATIALLVTCPAITLPPAPLPNGITGVAYNQSVAASPMGSYAYSVSAGDLPAGLMLDAETGAITGAPSATGVSAFTIKATDANGCAGMRDYTIIVTGTGLQFYPLPRPVRLLDTRAAASPNACDKPAAPIPGGTSRTQPAWGVCEGLQIPSNAAAITGNITTVQSGGGFLTLYPSDVDRPRVANSNYGPNEILNNVFTVGLGASDGAFKIYVTTDTDVVVDVTGYYAPPGAGGLYYHPLPRPVRLLDTRANFAACHAPGAPLPGATETSQLATGNCDGLQIPASAKAIVGNATTVSPQGTGYQYFTLFPADASRPTVASSNYPAGQIMNGPFTVGLSPAGAFRIYPTTQTELVIDVSGYYSPEAADANGTGLLFYPLPRPVRLLETRPNFNGCYATGAPLAAESTRTQPARGVCDSLEIPADAAGVVGNATVVQPLAGGWLTFFPSDATKPTVAQSNYTTGQIFNRHFIVGLGAADGAFNIFTRSTTHLVLDLSGYFAP